MTITRDNCTFVSRSETKSHSIRTLRVYSFIQSTCEFIDFVSRSLTDLSRLLRISLALYLYLLLSISHLFDIVDLVIRAILILSCIRDTLKYLPRPIPYSNPGKLVPKPFKGVQRVRETPQFVCHPIPRTYCGFRTRERERDRERKSAHPHQLSWPRYHYLIKMQTAFKLPRVISSTSSLRASVISRAISSQLFFMEEQTAPRN